MKKLFLCILLTGCATAPRSTTYEEAAREQYVGNETFEVRSDGNSITHGDDIRDFMYRKAHETCAKQAKGFVIVKQDDTTRTETYSTVDFWGHTKIHSRELPGARMIIKCDGAVDQKLAAKYGIARDPASK